MPVIIVCLTWSMGTLFLTFPPDFFEMWGFFVPEGVRTGGFLVENNVPPLNVNDQVVLLEAHVVRK